MTLRSKRLSRSNRSRLQTLMAGLCLSTTLAFGPSIHAADDKADSGKAAKPKPGLPAEVITLQPQKLSNSLQAVGNLIANEAVVIRPEQNGRIASIHFNEGDSVKQGQKLFVLDNATYNAALSQVEAKRSLSELEFKQAEQLLARKHGSRHERDRTRAQLQIDEARVKLAKAELAKMTLTAPFDGTIGFRNVSRGDYVSSGQDLVELVDLDTLKAEFNVPEKYLSKVFPGQSVLVSVDAFPGLQFNGEIYAVAPQLDQRGRSLQIRAKVANNQQRLRPGLFARIELVLSETEQALLLPEAAILPQGKAFFVYRVIDKTIEQVRVEIGARSGGKVQILDGLQPGDVIVTAGQLKLRPGSPVTPVFVDGSDKKADSAAEAS